MRLARFDPQTAVSCEASQRESAGGSDGDPGASRAGAGTGGAGEYGPVRGGSP
jgi:hypothetical protein